MCGIAGLVSDPGSHADIARDMALAIAYRGPDDAGVWEDSEAGVALSHRRLAIIDLSPMGHQPMASACGRYVTVFNGEIYNYQQMRAALEREGVGNWRGQSDTEVLLAAIAQWGFKRALQASVGMFAIAVWDRNERSLMLARDRFGEKPVYYGRVGKAFAFASELKAFRVLPQWQAEVDRGALSLLLRHNYIPAPHSIYRGVFKLRPGTLLVLRSGAEPRIESYWSAREVAQRTQALPFRGSGPEAVAQLETLLRQSLEGQMLADVPLGAFLSGGIDSSVVVAMMQAISRQPVRTFTIGFDQVDYDEATHAKQVAMHLGTDHTELYLSNRDALDTVPRLPDIYCEPFSDSSQIPTLLVSQLARRHVTVALSGDAGDELFSGYTRYEITDGFWNRLSVLPAPLRHVLAGALRIAPPAFYNTAMRLLPAPLRPRRFGDNVHKAAGLLALQSVDDVYLRLVSHWTDPASIVRDGPEPVTMFSGLEPLPPLDGSVERMMYLDLLSYLPDDILVKVDRAAMAVSLETRVPMLDHRLVEFAMSLPLSIRRANGVPKWPLKQLLYKYVPQRLVDRPKMGFGVPLDRWLRGPLRDWAEDLLGERRLETEGYFHSAPVRAAWDDHQSGRRNNQYLLWDVLMFQAWNAAR
ncbi:MAG: asparagine synthase (glutamine-hydrolyzing) [Pseudomonadota bacterium]|jgi:asparagine synthase (glutamine-hydrolysing)